MENLPPGPNPDANPQAIIPPNTVERADVRTAEITAAFTAAHVELPLIPPSGGDFHAAFSLKQDADKVAFVLGDVSGHGPQAAVHAEHLKAAIVGCLDEGLTPSDALGYVNAAAEMDPNFPGFATVIAGTVEAKNGQIVYASGGHEPALVAALRADGAPDPSTVQELTTSGPPVGAFAADEVQYSNKSAILPPGGTILLYSDGVTEARRGRNFVGFERLRGWLLRFLPLSPAQLIRKIFGSARAFIGGKRFRDDVALLAVRRRKHDD